MTISKKICRHRLSRLISLSVALILALLWTRALIGVVIPEAPISERSELWEVLS